MGSMECLSGHRNKDFLHYCLPRLTKYVNWVLSNRDSNQNSLLGWQIVKSEHCPCGESGMDNASRFFGELPEDCVDLNAFVVNEIRHIERIAEEIKQSFDETLVAQKETIIRLVNEKMWDVDDQFYYDLTKMVSSKKLKLFHRSFLLWPE